MKIKEINIGKMIEARISELKIEEGRICNFFQRDIREIRQMYQEKSMDSDLILKWSKLLEYDFFRIYSQHLILFSPQSNINLEIKNDVSSLPQFRKNLYTRELIDFILELINTGEKSKLQVIEEYNIPKTTLYKWLIKYKK